MGLTSDYFSTLFTAEVQNPDPQTIAKIPSCVSEAMNTALTAEYTQEELKKALFNIGDVKAPGPDGLHAVFLAYYWRGSH